MLKKSHKEFIKKFKTNHPILFNSLEVLEEYKNINEPILVKNEYGLCKSIPYHLLEGKTPTIKSAVNKNEYFSNQLKIKQPKLFDKIKVLGDYKSSNTNLLVSTKYGDCMVTPINLLQGTEPTILSAVDKHSFFIEKIKEVNPDIFNYVEIISEYKKNTTPIKVKDKYGECLMRPSSLLLGRLPQIDTAINKTEYFINQAKEIHGDLYDYSLVEYKNAHSKVNILCKTHGMFEQSPNGHLNSRGCPLCGAISAGVKNAESSVGWKHNVWERKGKKSKNFHSFKVYIIKCWNDTETFYKIGKTFKTVDKRFSTKTILPYNFRLLKEIEGDAKCISKLEQDLKNKNKEFKYIPLLKFCGMNECFSTVDLNIERELLIN